MWEAVQQRLDARWRRIAFVFWLPLIAAGGVFLAMAAYHGVEAWRFHRPFIDDCPALLRHDDPISLSMTRKPIPYKVGDYLNCMGLSDYRTALLNAQLLAMEAGRFFLWAGIFGFFILTHGWSRALRSFWGWINLRTPQA